MDGCEHYAHEHFYGAEKKLEGNIFHEQEIADFGEYYCLKLYIFTEVPNKTLLCITFTAHFK